MTANRRSRNYVAAEKIGQMILRGHFAPGVLLPNEAEWCKRLRMSRSVIREAVKMLSAKGLVLSRPKIGTRVQPRERWNLLDRDVLLWYAASAGKQTMLDSIQQMRRIFEPEAAALAAINHDQAQMEAISIACHEMGTAPTLEERIEADVRFHRAILQASGNEFLVPFGFLVESALVEVFDHVTRKIGNLHHAQGLHEDIERAIRRRRPEAARRAARRLLADTDHIVHMPARPRRAPLRKSGPPARPGGSE